MRAADRKPFVGKTRRVFRQSQTAREGGLFLRESPHQLPSNEHPIPRKYPPPFRQGRVWGREMRIATGALRPRNDRFPWSVVHGRRATARVAPTEGYKECLAGGRTGASAPTDMWKCLRRAACPHAAAMVQWVSGGGLRAARRPTILAPLPKGGWHGEAVTGGFLSAPASRKRTPHTPQVSLHQPSVGPPPFRQGRLWRRGADYRDRFVNWPRNAMGFCMVPL